MNSYHPYLHFCNRFHGYGVLHFKNAGQYEGNWEFGKSIQGKYTFADGLVYQEVDWKYCTTEDRRFYSEILNGLRPAGVSLFSSASLSNP